MAPFDTVDIKKRKEALASVPAEETISMQLFSWGLHLVESAAKLEAEVSSVHWNRRNEKSAVKTETNTEMDGGKKIGGNVESCTTVRGNPNVSHREQF